ncbi:hypothetical protein [Streptomyces sp. CC224B]|uniref:hypothetical protein n=1 Tax=Streptomyces sp. CC224B TaxID=3044571 RepID=UPI0024A8CA17|nr:hypothetical protein [Streptomyces sp. CC224B]
MKKTTARVLTLALTATAAVALTCVGTATADTNKSEQTSAINGPTAPILSPGTGPGDNMQANQQAMIKRNTTNWSLIDYIEIPSLPGAVVNAL